MRDVTINYDGSAADSSDSILKAYDSATGTLTLGSNYHYASGAAVGSRYTFYAKYTVWAVIPGGGQASDISNWTFIEQTTTTTIANWQNTPIQTNVTIDPNYRYVITESIMSDTGNMYTTNGSGDIINMTNHTQNSPITITRSGNTYTLYQSHPAYTTWTIYKFST